MRVDVETVKPNELLRRALQKMVRRNVGSVVVVEGEKPVGIVTERDISRCVARGTKALDSRVGKFMSAPPITVARSATTQEAMTTMLKHGIRRLLVVDEKKLVGIISERDLLWWVLKVTYEPNVPSEIKEILKRQPFSKK
jgi:CBS domain-containing protein